MPYLFVGQHHRYLTGRPPHRGPDPLPSLLASQYSNSHLHSFHRKYTVECCSFVRCWKCYKRHWHWFLFHLWYHLLCETSQEENVSALKRAPHFFFSRRRFLNTLRACLEWCETWVFICGFSSVGGQCSKQQQMRPSTWLSPVTCPRSHPGYQTALGSAIECCDSTNAAARFRIWWKADCYTVAFKSTLQWCFSQSVSLGEKK